jgi:hypothetical protein
MGPRPGFDWRRHLDLVIDTLRCAEARRDTAST